MKPESDMNIPHTHLITAGKEEIPDIQKIARAAYGPTYLAILGQPQVDYMLGKIYSTSALWEQMQQGHIFLIAQRQKKEVGFISYNNPEPGQKNVKLQKLYVLPEQQGTGLGAWMLNEVISRVRRLGGKTLQLNVNRFNRAKGFYEKMGFRVKETVDISIGEGYFMNDFVMQLDLEDHKDLL